MNIFKYNSTKNWLIKRGVDFLFSALHNKNAGKQCLSYKN